MRRVGTEHPDYGLLPVLHAVHGEPSPTQFRLDPTSFGMVDREREHLQPRPRT